MDFKNSTLWFWTSICLFLTLTMVVFWPKPPEEVKVEDTINMYQPHDSLHSRYAPYVGLAKAMKLRLEGKRKEANTIFSTLARSEDKDIAKIALSELGKLKPVDTVKEEKSPSQEPTNNEAQ